MSDAPAPADCLPPSCALVLHYRREAESAACLENLLAAHCHEALLVDNSEDGGASLARLQPALTALRGRGLKLEVLAPGTNLGFAAGVNAGLAHIARWRGARCVLLLNNDARLRPGAHPALRRALAAGADAAVARMHSPTGTTVETVHYHGPSGLLLRRALPGSFPYHSGCCVLLSPRLAGAPLFDERFFFYGEDIALGWRAQREGLRFVLAEGAAVDHAGSLSARTGSLFYEYHIVRAHWLLAAQLTQTPGQRLLWLAGRALSLPARALVRSARQRSAVPLRGLMLASLDLLRGRRRRVPPPAAPPADPAAP